MTQDPLSSQNCVVCEVGGKPLSLSEVTSFLDQTPGWEIDQNKLKRDYKFPDFKSALLFVNKVGEIAEQQGHHPNISFTWGEVSISLFTHSINGLSKNDFILAARINEIS